MKKTLTLLLALVIGLTVSAQIKRIAILETIDKENMVPYAIEVMVRSNLTKVISNTPGYEGYDRVNISQIMDEHDFERTGLVDEEQIRQLGIISGADYLLVSEAVKFDESNIFVTVKILNVETAKTERSENALMGMTAPDIQHGCESLANRLLGIPDPYLQEKEQASLEEKKRAEEKNEVATEEKKDVGYEKSTMSEKVKLGDLLNFTDGTQGIVFYIGQDGKGLVVSLDEGEEPWDDNRRTEDIGLLKNFEDDEDNMNYGVGAYYTKTLCSSLGDDARAAFWCRMKGEDWYLPSMGEFFILAKAFQGNPMLSAILKSYNGGEIDGWYWTSSEHDRKEAWNVSSGGSISTEIKREKNKVRAIRTFKEE